MMEVMAISSGYKEDAGPFLTRVSSAAYKQSEHRGKTKRL